MTLLTTPVTASDHAKGTPQAPITLVQYGDYGCPNCRLAHGDLRRLERALGPELHLVFRHYPVARVHPYGFLGAVAAEAAGRQGRFWEMHDALFENPEHLGPEGIDVLARTLGLDMARFAVDIDDEALANRVRADYMSGLRSGVGATPSYFLNGVRYAGPVDARALRQLVEAA